MELIQKKLELRNMQIQKRILEIDIAINSKKREILNNEVKNIDDRFYLNEMFSEEEYDEIIDNINSMEITDDYIQELIDNVAANSYEDEEGYSNYDFKSNEDYVIYLSFCTGLNDLKNKELEDEIAKLKKEKMELMNLELVYNDTWLYLGSCLRW